MSALASPSVRLPAPGSAPDQPHPSSCLCALCVSTVKPPSQHAESWIHINAAAEVMGVDERTLRRRCAKELRAKGLARQFRAGRAGLVWHVHCSIHPSLLRLSAGGIAASSAAESMSLFLGATEARRGNATAKAAAVARFRAWRSSAATRVKAEFPAWSASLSRELGIRIAWSQLHEWDRRCPAMGAGDSLVPLAAALLDRRGARVDESTGELARAEGPSPEAWDFFCSLYLRGGKPGECGPPTIRKCHDITAHEAARRGWRWPGSKRHTARLVAERISEPERVLAREGAKAFKSRVELPIEADDDAIGCGELWCADNTPFDFFARVMSGGTWVARRLTLTAWQDARSRRIMGWALSASGGAQAIKAALLMGLRAPGAMKPQRVRVDNGKDFAAAEFTGATKAQRIRERALSRDEAAVCDRSWQGLYAMLGIECHFATPYTPNAKARIERWFGTLHRDFDTEHPSWCGANPMERERAIVNETVADVMALPTTEELEQSVGAWIESYNHRRDHSIESLRDGVSGESLSPIEYYARHVPAVTAWRDERALTLLEARLSRPIIVGKRGVRFAVPGAGVTLGYGAECPEIQERFGRPVYVSYDPSDVTKVTVWDEAFRLVCIAPANPRHGGGFGAVSQEAVKRGMAAKREQKRRVKAKLDAFALAAPAMDVAARAQREMEIDETKARMRELGVADPPPLRLAETPFDGQADAVDRAEQRLRKAAGAESMSDRGPDLLDLLAREPLELAAGDADDADDWDGADPLAAIGAEAASSGEYEPHLLDRLE